METAANGSSLITVLVTFLILLIPTAILNAIIARRKGKSRALYGWISVIPFVGFYLLFFLISLPDKELIDKIDKLLAKG